MILKMLSSLHPNEAPQYWFVGASRNSIDLTQNFIASKSWEYFGNDEHEKSLIKTARPGDLIALKATYTKTKNIPFDNHALPASVMAIKAVGTITKNPGDGIHLNVDWVPAFDSPLEWFFYTYQKTVWRLNLNDWMAKELVDFAFSRREQDMERFRNDPYWKERFGLKEEFDWIPFYEETANKLRNYKENRGALIDFLIKLKAEIPSAIDLKDIDVDGKPKILSDVDPFTFISTFNRHQTRKNKNSVILKIKEFLNIEAPVPEGRFLAPSLTIARWFVGKEFQRKSDDIESLWNVFEAALNFADESNEENENSFVKCFDIARNIFNSKWNLIAALFLIRPWFYLSLDSTSQAYLKNILSEKIKQNGKNISAINYLSLCRKLKERFNSDKSCPVHSFPELSLEAYKFKESGKDQKATSSSTAGATINAYSIKNIVDDDCFLEEKQIRNIIDILQGQKNLILQGPPGTGKTWLAKRLAYALIEEENKDRVTSIQFHANSSYEDFVRGYRPSASGHLELMDGPMLKMVDVALKNPDQRYALIIEEINRANPAHVFGEMLTLIEADKRSPDYAMALSYPRPQEAVHVPPNLYLIGTMNTADRSLVQFDFALRRRFAFIDLEPRIKDQKLKDLLISKFRFDGQFVADITTRVFELNVRISRDTNLGPQYQIGHSFLIPTSNENLNPNVWFRNVVNTQIIPLLREYWFDDPQKLEEEAKKLRI